MSNYKYLEHDSGSYEMSEERFLTLMAHGAIRELENTGTYRFATAEEMSGDPGSPVNHPPSIEAVMAALLDISGSDED